MTSTEESILIVDDEDMVRLLVSRKLTGLGYVCQTANCAAEAIQKLKNCSVALVLLDVNMPGETGAALLPKIRAEYPDIPVIMATAVADMAFALDLIRHGAYDYLLKPFNLTDVTVSVTRALERRKLVLDNRNYQQHLEKRVAEQAEHIRSSLFDSFAALAFALEAKDPYTGGHSQRVSDFAEGVARHMGLPNVQVEEIKLAGLVHDIGKIGIRESVLNKPGRLTEDEFKHVSTHSELGAHILSPVVGDKELLRMVRHHHEYYDGSGYPDGITGDAIPLGARILSVADAFDAMTSNRPYREALNVEVALRAIERGKHSQFDPEVADAFLRIIEARLPVAAGV